MSLEPSDNIRHLPAERPWTDADVMEYLQVSRPTLYELRALGLPAHKLGTGSRSAVRYFRDEVDAWVREQAGHVRNRWSDNAAVQTA